MPTGLSVYFYAMRLTNLDIWVNSSWTGGMTWSVSVYLNIISVLSLHGISCLFNLWGWRYLWRHKEMPQPVRDLHYHCRAAPYNCSIHGLSQCKMMHLKHVKSYNNNSWPLVTYTVISHSCSKLWSFESVLASVISQQDVIASYFKHLENSWKSAALSRVMFPEKAVSFG